MTVFDSVRPLGNAEVVLERCNCGYQGYRVIRRYRGRLLVLKLFRIAYVELKVDVELFVAAKMRYWTSAPPNCGFRDCLVLLSLDDVAKLSYWSSCLNPVCVVELLVRDKTNCSVRLLAFDKVFPFLSSELIE